MAGPSATLFNHQTNTYEEVPADQVGAALASGQYTSAGGTTTSGDGGTVVRPAEQLGAAAVAGESAAGATNAELSAADREEQRRALVSDRALTFVEGVGDALTLGLLHGSREEDELRREVNSGSALLGQLLGTAAGLNLPGPISGIAKGGEALGEGVGRALLGEAETGFRGAVARGLSEASANAALLSATAFGHQLSDAVIADKPFAAESIASEAGVGALLGFGFGFAGSALGQLARASRGAVEASGVATKESRAALDAVSDLTRTWDDAVEQHAQRVGVLKALAEDGHIPGDLYPERATALREAERARDALRGLDSERALGGDPKEFEKWRDAVERYQSAVVNLDEKLTPSGLERASANKVVLGDAADLPGAPLAAGDIDAQLIKGGVRTSLAEELDKAFTPEARARYEEIYGRPYEPLPKLGQASPDEANLGGRVTPTSENGTNPGFRKGRQAPKEVVQAGDQPASPAQTGQEFVDHAKTEVDRPGPATLVDRPAPDVPVDRNGTVHDLPAPDAGGRSKTVVDRTVVDAERDLNGTVVDRPAPNAVEPSATEAAPGSPEGKKAVRDYLNSWFKEFDAKPRVSVGDQLQARLGEALDNIAKSSGGRLDSAGSLELLKALKLKEATTPLGQRLDQVWSLGQAGRFAADEARGVATPLRRGLVDRLKNYATQRGARAIGAAALGGSVGGPVGAIVGLALTSAGFAGSVASTAGKLAKNVAAVGEALLKGKRATIVARAVAGNRPYQYSDAGPIKDPVQRIQELQRLASNPEAIRTRVTRQLGDVALTSPDVAAALAETTVRQITAIAQSSPVIALTPLGKPIPPSGTALSRFFDFENAMHDLPGTLQAIARGNASSAQIQALHLGYPAVHGELLRGVIGRNADLEKLEEAKLRTIGRVLGVPLTRAAADPTIVSRYQNNWESAKPAQPQSAQAFKITAPKPTAVQSADGDRAPGNERKRP